MENEDFGSLSKKQVQAVPLLAAGLTDQEVAEAVGVTRQTVNKWKNHDLEFKDYLDYERVQLWQSYSDRVRALIPKALKVLEDSLESEDVRIRLDVAKMILNTFKAAPLTTDITHPDMGKEMERQNRKLIEGTKASF